MDFKPLDENEDNVIKPGTIKKLHGGATWALNQLVAGTPLMRALKATFPKYKTYLRLLGLIYFLVINRNSSLCDYEEFAESTWLPYKAGVTSGSLSRLLQGIDKDKISRFLNTLNKEYVKQQGGAIRDTRFWALDSTSITSYSENITSVGYGHNKDLIRAAQTNVLLIIDQKSGEVIYYRNFDGNVPDVSTVRNTIAELAMMKIGYNNVILVTDKGYGSNANWNDMLRNNLSFVSNAKLNLNAAIKEIVDEHYAELLDWNNGISFIKQNAVTVPVEWHYDEFPVAGKRQQKKEKKKLYVHLYFAPAINDDIANGF